MKVAVKLLGRVTIQKELALIYKINLLPLFKRFSQLSIQTSCM
jgi:hypothetical protein